MVAGLLNTQISGRLGDSRKTTPRVGGRVRGAQLIQMICQTAETPARTGLPVAFEPHYA